MSAVQSLHAQQGQNVGQSSQQTQYTPSGSGTQGSEDVKAQYIKKVRIKRAQCRDSILMCSSDPGTLLYPLQLREAVWYVSLSFHTSDRF